MITINTEVPDSSTTTPSAIPTVKKKKMSWIKRFLIAFCILVLLPIMAVSVARLIYNDTYIKEKIQAALRDTLGRDVVIEELACSLYSGKLKISGVIVPNAEAGFKEKDTARIAEIECEFSTMALLWSGGLDLRGIKVFVRKPEVHLERLRFNKMSKTNIDDLIKKFTAGPSGTWPKHTNLSGLGVELFVEDGRFVFRDSDPMLGESCLERFKLHATQDGLGSPLISKIEFELKTPSKDASAKFVEASGHMEIESNLFWIDAAGVMDIRAFKDISASAKLAQMDFPHVLRYFGGQFFLKNEQFVCTLGKPLTGVFKLTAPKLETIAIEGHFDTDGAISLFDNVKNSWVAGALPAKAVFAAQFGFVDGVLKEGPVSAKYIVGASKASLQEIGKIPLLDFQISAEAANGKDRSYVITLKTTQELLATDVAKVLDLTGSIEGLLEGRFNIIIQNDQLTQMTGTLKTQGETKAPLDASFDMKFGSKEIFDKTTSLLVRKFCNAELSFQAKAGTAFEMSSVRPAKLISLEDLSQLALDAEMDIKVLGKELFDEYGSVLAVVSIKDRLEESLTGKLFVKGSAGKIHLDLEGTLQEQHQTPNPIHLNLQGDYDGVALTSQIDSPWLKLLVRLKSAADKSMDVKIPLSIVRGKYLQILDLPEFSIAGDLAGLLKFNRRLGVYGAALPPEYDASGFIAQTGSAKLTQTFDDNNCVVLQKFNFNADIKLAQAKIQGPRLSAEAPPLAWTENETATLHVNSEINLSEKSHLLTLKSLILKSSLLSAELQLNEFDCLKIKNLSADEKSKIAVWASIFDKGFLLKSLAINPEEILKFSAACGVGGTTVKNLLDGKLRFSPLWNVSNMAVHQTAKNAYEMHADISTPCGYHPSPKDLPLISIEGAARILTETPLKIVFKDSGDIALQGDINMSGVDVFAPSLKLKKSAGMPSSYSVNLTYGADGNLRVHRFDSTGGPWIFSLNDLFIVPGKTGLSNLSLSQITMTTGPFLGTARDFSLDVATDTLKVVLEMANVDVGPLYALNPLSPNLQVTGNAKDVKIQYDGKLSALKTQKFTPADKLAVTLTTALHANATDGHSTVGLNIVGDLKVTQQRLSSQSLTLDAERNFDQHRIANHLTLSLDVAPRDPNVLLFNALSMAGLPLLVKVPISSDRIVDKDVVETLNVVLAALDPTAKPSKPGDFSGISQLRLESSFAAPHVKSDTLTTGTVALKSLLLDRLKGSISESKVQLYEGEICLNSAAYNLASLPLVHEQNVTLTHLDLHALMGKSDSKDSYEIYGFLGGVFQLSGSGFERLQQRSWNGTASIVIQNFIAKKQSGNSQEDPLKKLGMETASGLLSGFLGNDVGRVLDIFSDDFGIFLNQMEFEPIKIDVKIENGLVSVQRGSLVGKQGTRSAGLQLDFSGMIDLPSQTFKPNFKIWIIALPLGTQKHLRIDQLEEGERVRELALFSAGKFQPLVLKGPLNSSVTSMMNLIEFSHAFYELDKRVAQALSAKKARESGTSNPASPTKEPPPAEKKPSMFDMLNGMIDKKKKK